MKLPLIEPLESRIAPAGLTISSVSKAEGNSGNTAFEFTVSISENPTANVTVSFSTADGSALAGSDYTVASGTLTFTPGGGLTRTITVDVAGDVVSEADETFSVTLSNATAGTTIDTATGTGTILNDPLLTFTKQANLYEGNSGTQTFNYTATLTEAPLAGDVTASFLAAGIVGDNSATPGTDFLTTSGTLTFSVGGPTTQTVPVTIVGDTDAEADESFELRISNVTGATLVTTDLQAKILNDLLTVRQLTPTLVEGSSGQQLVMYEIELSDYAATFPLQVSYQTVSGSGTSGASAGTDFSALSGSLTFNALGTQTFSVAVYGDLVAEQNETFVVRTATTTPAFSRDFTATIPNDDISFSIADNVETLSDTKGLAEGNSGTTLMGFKVAVTGAISAPVTLHYRTVDGTGNRGAISVGNPALLDFVRQTDATVTFNPGDTEKTISIQINGDNLAELSESFTVELFQVDAAPGVVHSFTDATATGTIKNDDVTVNLSSLGSVAEGQSGTTNHGFRVTITEALPAAVSFTYSTTDGAVTPLVLPTGAAGANAASGDYIAVTNGTVTIPAGQTSADFFVTVRGDTVKESDEVFTVSLPTNVPDTIIGTRTVLGTITNDDPSVRIGDVTVSEGTGGTATATFVVSLTEAPGTGRAVTVNWSTLAGTAVGTGTADFTPLANQTLTFGATETQKTITVNVVGDNRFEGVSEQFSVALSNAKLVTTTGTPTETPLAIARGTGTATILDDDAPTFSIGPAVRALENSPAAVFAVTLSNPSDIPVAVDFRTQNGTAIAGSDYTPLSTTTLTFAPGEVSKNVSVSLLGDTVNEADETFQLLLSNARVVGGSPLTIAKSAETATIVNDDRIVTIGSASLTEASAPMNFTVTLSATSANPVTVFYTTREAGIAPNSATAGSDFTARTGSIVIPANSTTGTIAIPILADTTDEVDQTFEVVITSVTNAVPGGTGFGIGTIVDNDAAPTLQIVPTLSVNEGTTDSNASFTVTLSHASERTITASFTTAAGTAQAGSDFTTTNGTVTVPAGQLSSTFLVPIKADAIAEPNETFTATLSAPVNAVLGTQITSTATIVNDDTAPTLSIADVSGLENAGTFTFTVALSRSSTQAVTVQYTTVDNTALAGSDYTAKSNSLTFAPTETVKTFTVSITDNNTGVEGDERFLVRLSNPTNATLADAEAIGTIRNDDTSFSIGDVTIVEEGTSGAARSALVTVTRSGLGDSSVQFRTVDGTALSANGRDYTATTGTLTFTTGNTQTISIPITADTAYENSESFLVELFSPVNAIIADGSGTVTISDNDVAPKLTSSSVSFTEGTTGNTMNFVVQLSAANEREDVTLQYEAINGTADGQDFTGPGSGGAELRFAKGETSRTIQIPIADDTRDEADQTFTVRLKNANAAFTAGGATLDLTGTIIDNDAAPTLSITNSLTISESQSGSTSQVFNVQLSSASELPVTVRWGTADATTGSRATAGADYTSVSNALLTFAPGETAKTFSVAVLDDALNEDSERFDVVLSNPTNATLATARNTGVITDNDAQPVLVIGDTSMVEGAAPAMLFTVSLSAPSGRAITVNYSTGASGDTATSSGVFSDYIAQSGTLTFAAGETSKTVAIAITDDAVLEKVAVVVDEDTPFTLADEKFTVTLSSAVNATLGNTSAQGLILNGGDATLGLVVSDAVVVEGATNATTQVNFVVQLSAPAPSGISFSASTRNGTASATDFGAIANAFSIAGPDGNGPGATSVTIPANVVGDALFEATESFFLDLTGFSGDAFLANRDSDGRVTARGTIYNDDIQFLNGGRTVQWVDVDGDLVTLTSSRGSFTGLDTATFSDTTGNKLWLQPTGTVGGRQLVLLSLLNLGGFAGASVSITADKQPGFSGVTDGLVNVGEIRAAQRTGGELDWTGVDLLDVTVEGDLTKIVAGDNVSTTAIRKLDVQSLGVLRNAPSATDFQSEVLGPIGTVRVHGDIGGQLKVIGQEFGRIGTLTVDGALRGGTAAGSGSIIVSGRVAVSTFGEIIGGAGDTSGALVGNQNNGGTLGNVTVLGAVQGGAGVNSGILLASSIGAVKLGSLVGGAGEDSGSVQSLTSFISSLTISGSLIGGTGVESGRVAAQTSIGQVKIGAVVGGGGTQSGSVFALSGSIAGITIDGSVTGSTGAVSARLAASTAIGFLKIGGDLVGGSGSASGSILTFGNLGTTTVAGDVIGGTGAESGYIQARSTPFLSIGGDLQGGTQSQSGAVLIGQKVTQNNQTVFVGGFARTLRIGGDVIGGAGSESGMVLVGSSTTTTVGGAIIGGAGAISGAVRFLTSAAQINVGENSLGQSVVGGAGEQSGRIRVDNNVSVLTLAGDIVGGAGNFTGAVIVGGDLAKATIRGSIIGGTAPATGSALQSSGFLSVGLLKSGVISGNLQAGNDLGAGVLNSGAIRTGRIESLVIEGSVLGNANSAAIISAAATIDASNVAIKSLLIRGNVSFAEILGGYDGSLTQSRGSVVNADAQIGTVQILGNTQALNIVAGAAPGADGRFGDATDILGNGTGVRDSSRVVSSIASVILRGSVLANSASYGIVAQHIVSVKTGPTAVSLAGLAPGAGNDLATANPNASDLIATNFRAVEVAV